MKLLTKRHFRYSLILCTFLFLALCLSLTACRDDGQEETSGTSDIGADASDAPSEPLTDRPGTDPVTLPGTEPGSAEEPTDGPTEVPTAGSTDAPTDTVTEKATFEDQEPESEPEHVIEIVTLPDMPFDPSSVAKEPMARLDIVTDNGRMIDGNNIDKPVYHSKVTLSNCSESFAFTDLGANVHVRGNSTAGAPKKPYALKFDEKQSMLGLNNGKSFKSWVLLADYYDETMLRNWMAFRLGDVMLENKWFSADATHVELYINGKYQGVYTLCEKTQIKKNRINIPEKEAADLKTLQTGYLLIGQGGIWWEENHFDIPIDFRVTDRNGKPMDYDSIRFVLSNGDEYSQAQRDYISAYCSAAFKVIGKAIYNHEYYQLTKSGELHRNTRLEKDTTKTEAEKQIETISAVLDIDAAARMCIVDEISKNLDAMTFNLYVDLSPDGDGRLTLAAPWDFDHAMAKTHYSTTHSTRDWYATALSQSDGIRVNFLTVMLGSTDWFNEMCSDLWKSHYDAIRASVNALLTENYRFEEAFERDWEQWGHPLNRAQTGHNTPADEQTFKTHTDSAVFLANWLTARITWLNTQWGDGTPEDLPVPDESMLRIDFTKEYAKSYLTGFNDCEYKLTENGLELTVTGSDPYFSVDFSWLEAEYQAEDFPYAVIYCKTDKNNSAQEMYFEYHMCAGPYTGATSGVKTGFNLDNAPGVMRRYETDLGATGFWSGTIHSLRVDFFSGCKPGDKMIIKKIEINRKSVEK
ncbi:MAG: CotH kinase family protein [Clostridia bacterium]|nr:CotH kinase family protein [Clostridia bacterium]